ncbi:MAG TPA: hypothetical protein VHY75_16360 [Steroidobacteraceae bacterium]|jgi:hypothetical protein|nr:hypothetical protein [Steroidobacteraceae bacterium]
MQELDRALLDISFVREHIARTTQFKGYGPLTLAATGLFALGVAALQAQRPGSGHGQALEFIGVWCATAAFAVTLIGIEAIVRSRRLHGGMMMEMLQSAIEQFLPAMTAGILVTFALSRWSPGNLWMLPGLWQIIFSLGVFATARILPKTVFIVGIWYLGCGLACLAMGQAAPLSPWFMGIPFGGGQLLVACILELHRHSDHQVEKGQNDDPER